MIDVEYWGVDMIYGCGSYGGREDLRLGWVRMR